MSKHVYRGVEFEGEAHPVQTVDAGGRVYRGVHLDGAAQPVDEAAAAQGDAAKRLYRGVSWTKTRNDA